MTTRNEHTGQLQQTKVPSNEYKEGWERIFGKDKPAPLAQSAEQLPCKQ
jgi:hypothetical protein